MSAHVNLIQRALHHSDKIFKRTEESVGQHYDWEAPFSHLPQVSKTVSGGSESRYGYLADPLAFGEAGRERWALFWAFEFATNSHLERFSQMHEETRTASYLGAVAMALAAIEAASEDQLYFSCYFADCRSDKTETYLGADFAFVMPLGDDAFKIALFQAKNVRSDDGRADLYRQSPAGSNVQQIDRLLEIDKKVLGDISAAANTLLGHLSYYAFWHNVLPKKMPAPSIISARQASAQVNIGRRRKNWQVDPMKGATSMSHALSLLLPERDSKFGALLNLEQVVELLSNERTRPKEVLGVAGPSSGFEISNWRNLLVGFEPREQEVRTTSGLRETAAAKPGR